MSRFLKRVNTALKFTANLPTTGALFQTSKKAGREITKYIHSSQKQIIVELGAGHGNITTSILAKMNPYSKLYVFEINVEFCKILEEIDDERLIVINASAEHLGQHITFQVDCIISTLPLTFISKEIVLSILGQCQKLLAENGRIIQILYSTFHLKMYRTFFPKTNVKVLYGLPFEFIYSSSK